MAPDEKNRIQTVAVVGLGPAGLAATKELLAAGLEPTAFERRDEIGGMWCINNRNSGVYKELTLNTTRSTSEFSDFAWNAEDYCMQDAEEVGGFFASQKEAGAYLRAYADHFELSERFRLGTTVASISRSSDEMGGNFLVTTIKAKGGKRQEEEFDAVILCNGRFTTPKMPLKDKLSNYTGKILHSQEVNSLEDFRGQRVLVVGGAVSGSDIACHLSRKQYGAELVVNSVRRPHYLLDKFTEAGPSLELAFFKRLGLWLKPYLPESLVLSAFKADTLKHYPTQLTLENAPADVVPDPEASMKEMACAYTSGYIQEVQEKRLFVKPNFVSAEGKTVTFIDGTSQEFDAIISATGYTGLDLSFFTEDFQKQMGAFVGPSGMTDVAAYKRTLVPDVRNLAVTKTDCFGAQFPLVEMQARYVAAIWSGKIPRPAESDVRKGAEAIKTIRMQGKHTTYDLTHEVIEELGDELGVTPTLWQALRHPSDLLLGPLYPSYYRTHADIDGEEVAAAARERLAWCKAHPAIRRDE